MIWFSVVVASLAFLFFRRTWKGSDLASILWKGLVWFVWLGSIILAQATALERSFEGLPHRPFAALLAGIVFAAVVLYLLKCCAAIADVVLAIPTIVTEAWNHPRRFLFQLLLVAAILYALFVFAPYILIGSIAFIAIVAVTAPIARWRGWGSGGRLTRHLSRPAFMDQSRRAVRDSAKSVY